MKNSINIFVAELVGTFGLVVAATGSIVFDGRMDFSLGPIFVAGMHFLGLTILVYSFGKYSMAHFNPAVTIGFAIAGYLKPKLIPIYFIAQAIGAVSGSLFVKFVIGNYAKLGLNFPNYDYSMATIFGVEILATIFLMGVILIVVTMKRLHIIFVSMAIGAIIALDISFLGPISGASMNPIRSFSPALVSGIFNDLWIYLTAPFIGTAIIGLIYRKKFSHSIPQRT